MKSEQTMPPIAKAPPSVCGVILYDGQCGFCSRLVNVSAAMLAKHGIEIASLDQPWVADRVKLPYEELIHDIRLLTPEDKLVSGADVYLYVTQRVWWAWPFSMVFSLPGLNWLIHKGYRWFAYNRHRVSRVCKLQPR